MGEPGRGPRGGYGTDPEGGSPRAVEVGAGAKMGRRAQMSKKDSGRSWKVLDPTLCRSAIERVLPG